MAEENEPHEYASPPCYQHELDPDYLGIEHSNEHQASNASPWASVRTWRVRTRSRLIALRESLTADTHAQGTRAIVKHLAETDILCGHTQVGFYWPMAGEIDLVALMNTLSSQGTQAALPVITELNKPLEFWAWSPGDTLDESGHWGIPVPARRHVVEVTALLIPLVGFDDQGHRLGHGGGYYDRTLASMNPRPKTIGIGFEACRIPSIFPQAHDVPMDIIVTDAGEHRSNANAAPTT